MKGPVPLPLFFQEAIRLTHGQEIHHNTAVNADGTCERWRINGKVKLWKKNPRGFRIPLKRGLYEFDYLTDLNYQFFHLPSKCHRQ